MNHKCRVFKYPTRKGYDWITMCDVRNCAYLKSETWEEALLEALHHRMRNQ
jgi:hypothetical protein